MGRNLILTGLPRSGTTLACRLLGECRDTVALSEPMEIEGIPADPPERAIEHVAAWMAEARQGLLDSGTGPSKVGPGGLVDNPFTPTGIAGTRELQVSEGVLTLQAAPPPGFTLVVKHNAAFTALLPTIAQRLPTLAVVRHPLAVLASWASLSLPVSAGQLPAGERFDPALADALRATPAPLSRQLLILSWFFARYQTLPASAVVRYEDVVASDGAVLFGAAGLAHASTPRVLRDLNTTPQCPRALLPELADALQRDRGPWTQWYPPTTIASMLGAMEAT